VSTGFLEVKFLFFLSTVIVDFSPYISYVWDFLLMLHDLWESLVKGRMQHCVLNWNALSSRTMLGTGLCFLFSCLFCRWSVMMQMVTFWNWMNHIRVSGLCSLCHLNQMDYHLAECTHIRYTDYKLLYKYVSARDIHIHMNWFLPHTLFWLPDFYCRTLICLGREQERRYRNDLIILPLFCKMWLTATLS
jgi:hypothetical protein